MKTYDRIKKIISEKGAGYFILIDPDKLEIDKINNFVKVCDNSGVDGFLVGGSLMINGDLNTTITEIKKHCNLPVIIFPGSINQISPNADAILFLSLISGRNPEHLIGTHVQASPILKKYGLEPISTGYMLIESGRPTTAQYVSGTNPIPANKPEIAAATALAGEFLGMKLIYLEGGSGADNSVPEELIENVSENVNIPIIVGGGIISPQLAKQKVDAGANIIITGNFFENENNWTTIKEFAQAIHK